MYTKESLQQEQRRLKLVIKVQETDLRQRLKKVPGELLYAGASSVIPTVLTGTISHTILNAGKNFINQSFVKKKGGNTSGLFSAARKAGIYALLRMAFTTFLKKSRK